MTAMREARGDSASADPLNGTRGKANITRPDYRSLPTSAATSQSSVPSTPVTIPLKTNGAEQIIFREFGAPIATPEDEEMLDDLEIKSEPVLSPRRTFTDFSESHSDEKENREEDTDADTTLREEIEEDQDMMMTSDVIDNEEKENLMEEEEKKNEDSKTEEAPRKPEESGAKDPQEPDKSESDSKDPKDPKPTQNLFVPPHDFIRMVESAPELTNPFRKSPEDEKKEAEEIRKMTESYGEPRKAVLQRVNLEETDDDETETETETENEEMEDDEDDLDDDVRRQIAAVSDIPMVFGWNGGKKEKMEKPTSLPLHYEVEAECSTPRRAEFSINPEDEEPSSEDPTACPSSSAADEGVLQQSLLQLQKQLRKTDVRCSRLEKICEFQQRDIDSLRFEVDWKDKRIEYLQKTLQEMELSAQTTDASSIRSTSTS
ncbi:hypothetical protein CAEBREN_24861 [Caenorhabditis brenneri]|uniref:Uncharacterized protein n=1 Tax=Caenorhabditis brenneri TaxID=135651 RepID=G0MEZ4_CAEBE|nr:hypothetical protein CAEBREN_24861 [Caenorhabditis brenneri]